MAGRPLRRARRNSQPVWKVTIEGPDGRKRTHWIRQLQAGYWPEFALFWGTDPEGPHTGGFNSFQAAFDYIGRGIRT